MKNMKAYGIDLFGKAWFLHMLNQKKKMTQISPFSGGKKKKLKVKIRCRIQIYKYYTNTIQTIQIILAELGQIYEVWCIYFTGSQIAISENLNLEIGTKKSLHVSVLETVGDEVCTLPNAWLGATTRYPISMHGCKVFPV